MIESRAFLADAFCLGRVAIGLTYRAAKRERKQLVKRFARVTHEVISIAHREGGGGKEFLGSHTRDGLARPRGTPVMQRRNKRPLLRQPGFAKPFREPFEVFRSTQRHEFVKIGKAHGGIDL